MNHSYIKNCFIKMKHGDTDIFHGTVKNGILEDVTVKLDGYAVIPIDEYKLLARTTSETVDSVQVG